MESHGTYMFSVHDRFESQGGGYGGQYATIEILEVNNQKYIYVKDQVVGGARRTGNFGALHAVFENYVAEGFTYLPNKK